MSPSGLETGRLPVQYHHCSFEARSKDVRQYHAVGGNPTVPLPPPPVHDRSGDVRPETVCNRLSFKAWWEILIAVLKYLDDNVIHEKLCFNGLVIDENRQKIARATRLQNLFRRITVFAEALGMKVNASKTVALCVSDARTYEPVAFMEDSNGNKVFSQEKMKVLGITFSK